MPADLNWPAIVTLAVLAVMFAAFVRERHPPEVVAIGGAAFLMATGILPVNDVLMVFANPAPVTIGAMFILSGALVRTGALDAFSRAIAAHAARRPALVLAGFAGFTLTASAFMNNTPVVVMLIPVALRLAGTLKISASKLLIPLSYVTIVGGMCTLIGTSTNILVDGVARSTGLEGFSLFEVTPVAVPIALGVVLATALLAPRLLPDREAMIDFLGARKKMKFFTEVVIPEGSALVGRKVLQVELFQRTGMTVIDVLRGDESLRRQMVNVTLEPGDRVVIRTGVNELLGLRENKALSLVGQIDALPSRSTVTVEALITPECRMVGRFLGQMRLRRRYGVYPLAVHRRAERVGTSLDEVRIRVGDTLLLEGTPDDIRRLAADQDLVDLTQPTDRPYRREKAPLVLGLLALVVVGSAAGLMPIAGLSVIAVALVLLLRCIDADEAFQMIDGRLLALILAMLAVGTALEGTGAVQMIVDGVAPALDGLPGVVALAAVIVLASLLTELISNNAVAVVVTPIAITLAQSLGHDPRPFVVGVMIAASASFATPIGYQTNTLVYAPGGYRFTDYMRMGVPMNLVVAVLATALIPLVFPL